MDQQQRRERLGNNIKMRRVEAGLTMRRLAQMAGTSHNYLWEVERGGVSVGFDLLCKFADALGVPVCDLIDF